MQRNLNGLFNNSGSDIDIAKQTFTKTLKKGTYSSMNRCKQ